MAIYHWKIQRISAILLVPAVIYITFYFLNIGSLSYLEVINDITSNFGILFVIFVAIVLFTHSSLGIETIMEDYIHDNFLQRLFINLSKVIHVILLLTTLISLTLIKGI